MKTNLLKQRLGILGICCGMVVMAMIFSMVNMALPVLHTALHASLRQTQWVMNIFGVVVCASLVLCGRLADIYGRKKICLIGYVTLAIALLGGGLSHSINSVIFFMAFAGLGNAIMLPVSQAMLMNIYPEDKKGRAIGLWTANVGLALAAGPVIGGVLLSFFGWRAIYLAPLVVVLLGFFLVAMFAPESKNTEDPPRLDVIGAMLVMFTIGSFVLAIVQGGFWRASIIVGIYGFSLVSLIVLLLYERKASQPIIREDLFTNRRFVLSSIANGCLIFFVWAVFFSLPFYMQTVAKFSPLLAGLILLLVNVPLIFLAQPIGRYCDQHDLKKVIAVGFVMLFLSLVCQYIFSAASPIWLFALAAVTFGLGWVAIWGPTTTAAVSTLASSKAGIASGTFITIQEIGGTLGLAIVGSVIRSTKDFQAGFHQGLEVLFGVVMLGLIMTLLLKNTNTAKYGILSPHKK